MIEIAAMEYALNTNSCDVVRDPQQRRKIGPTRRSISGVYAFRAESSIEFESSLERDFLIRMEFFLDVLDVIPQPVEIPFKALNGRNYIYTPDFLVYYRLGNAPYGTYPKPQLIEVKPREIWKAHMYEWLPKWKAAHRYAKDQGWEFHLKDESRIRDQTLENIRFLEKYKRMAFPQEESEWILKNLKGMGCAPVHFLLARHFMGIYRTRGIAHLWNLLATRKLDCDIGLPLDEDTELWIPDYD